MTDRRSAHLRHFRTDRSWRSAPDPLRSVARTQVAFIYRLPSSRCRPARL